MGKKKFIDKKKAATFQLFFRDSTDEAEGSSEKVFIRTDEGSNHVPGFSDDYVPKEGEADSSTPGPPHYFDEEFLPSRFNVKPSLPLTDEKRREIVEFGLQDDGYDYTQHLRTIGQARGLGVFIPASKVEPIVEENVKIYDASKVRVKQLSAVVLEESADDDLPIPAVKAVNDGTREVEASIDKEILKALESREGSEAEEDFGSDLEDDFVLKANAEGESEEEDKITEEELETEEVEENQDSDEDEEDEIQPNEASVRERRWLDEEFEQLELREYNEEEDEEEEEEIGGHADLSQFNDVLDEFLTENKPKRYPLNPIDEENGGLFKDEEIRKIISSVVEEEEDNKGKEEEIWIPVEEEKHREQWDCETIVSTYSNLENHPKTIEDPWKKPRNGKKKAEIAKNSGIVRLVGKAQLPVDYLPERLRGGKKAEAEKEKDEKSSTEGKKSRVGETAEEKKQRKKEIKDLRREMRAVKKETKLLYRKEGLVAQQGAARSTPQGMRLQ